MYSVGLVKKKEGFFAYVLPSCLLLLKEDKAIVLFAKDEFYKEEEDLNEVLRLREQALALIYLENIKKTKKETLGLRWWQSLKALKKRKDIVWLQEEKEKRK